MGLASLAPNGGRADVIAPGQGWSDVLVQQSTLDLIYALYAVCRFSSNGTIAHACRQSLVDMAAIKGDVFPDENARSAYLDYTLQSVLNLMSAVSDVSRRGLSNTKPTSLSLQVETEKERRKTESGNFGG